MKLRFKYLTRKNKHTKFIHTLLKLIGKKRFGSGENYLKLSKKSSSMSYLRLLGLDQIYLTHGNPYMQVRGT